MSFWVSEYTFFWLFGCAFACYTLCAFRRCVSSFSLCIFGDVSSLRLEVGGGRRVSVRPTWASGYFGEPSFCALVVAIVASAVLKGVVAKGCSFCLVSACRMVAVDWYPPDLLGRVGASWTLYFLFFLLIGSYKYVFGFLRVCMIGHRIFASRS